jgi:heme/copper-type cytochrome/quinol oxidase subunit 2
MLGTLPGCADSLSAVHPAGPAAAAIATLWWVMLAGASVIFLMVMGLVGLAFRHRPADGIPGPEKGAERVWLLGLGLGFSLSVLALLLGYGLVIGERLLPRPGADVVRVAAVARQWSWRFAYADAPGRVTENILNIPAGRPVDVQISTEDVIHSFWVPRLAGKLDAVPGHVNTLRLEAWEPGRYQGVSAEFSGPGYRGHTFTVVAHAPAEWDAFLKGNSE